MQEGTKVTHIEDDKSVQGQVLSYADKRVSVLTKKGVRMHKLIYIVPVVICNQYLTYHLYNEYGVLKCGVG